MLLAGVAEDLAVGPVDLEEPAVEAELGDADRAPRRTAAGCWPRSRPPRSRPWRSGASPRRWPRPGATQTGTTKIAEPRPDGRPAGPGWPAAAPGRRPPGAGPGGAAVHRGRARPTRAKISDEGDRVVEAVAVGEDPGHVDGGEGERDHGQHGPPAEAGPRGTTRRPRRRPARRPLATRTAAVDCAPGTTRSDTISRRLAHDQGDGGDPAAQHAARACRRPPTARRPPSGSHSTPRPSAPPGPT